MKIVKFKDGKFAIRKVNIFGYEYLDKESKNYWWPMARIYYDSFMFNNFEDCKKRLNDYNNRKKRLKHIKSNRNYGKVLKNDMKNDMIIFCGSLIILMLLVFFLAFMTHSFN